MVVVVSGSRVHSSVLGGLLASALGCRRVGVYSKRFPDGEVYVRVDGGVRGEVVVLVQSMESPQVEGLFEVLLLADALYEAGASDVILYAPYLPFARQDRVFLDGEPVSVRVVLKSLYSMGVRRLVTVEAHSVRALSYYPGEALNLRPLPYIVRFLGLSSGVLVVSPDFGGVERADSVAGALGADRGYMVKRRDRVTGEVSMEPGDFNPRGRDVIIVDDIISTGDTIALASRTLYNMGARSVSVIAVHLLGIPGSLEKIRASGVGKLTVSNSLPPAGGDYVSYVDLSPLAAEAVSRWTG